MKRKWMQTGTAFFALLLAAITLAGCANHDADVKAAHAGEDASAKQAHQDKKNQ